MLRRAILAAAVVLLIAAGPAPQPGGVVVRTADYAFSYRWPASVEAIPALRARLAKDQDAVRRTFAHEAADARREAASDPGRPFLPHELSVEWRVTATLPGWLSLSQHISVFEGGAHPNSGFDSLVWDRKAGVERPALDLFASPEALDAAIGAPFCEALDRERAARRGAPVDRASGDEFDACIRPSGQAVVLGSTDRKRFNRIGILVAPYAAGPYVEGAYEVTLPVTAVVLEAVKPEFRAAFGP
jgi:hypothetical protein